MSDFVIKNGVLKKYTGKAEHVIIPEGVTEIGNKETFSLGYLSMGELSMPAGAFEENKKLVSVKIPEGCEKISGLAFMGCSNLKTVEIPSSVTIIKNSAFSHCTGLTSIQLPEGVTEIGNKVFYKCSSLTSVYLPDSVTTIGNQAFEGCSSLEMISLPENVQFEPDSFPETAKIIYRKKELSADKNFMIKDHVLLTYLGDEEFVKIPENVFEIASSAFANHEFLLSVDIPDSVAKIHDCAFSMCSHLEKVSIPQSAKIGENIFYGCESLYTLGIRFAGGASGIFDKSALETMFQKL